ncbi:hypothetical protein EB118_13995 [bacterium]|nr:hypothetical protein [bacterium]
MAIIAFNEASFNTGHPCTVTDTLQNPISTNVFIQGNQPLLSGAGTSHIYQTPKTIYVGDPPVAVVVQVCEESHDIVYSGGSSTVFVNGHPIGFVGDPVEGGTISGPGATTVFCG